MKKKIFFTDLDGTLLDSRKQISQKNRDAIEAAREHGHSIVRWVGGGGGVWAGGGGRGGWGGRRVMKEKPLQRREVKS